MVVMERSVRGVPLSPDPFAPPGGDATDAPDPVALGAWAVPERPAPVEAAPTAVAESFVAEPLVAESVLAEPVGASALEPAPEPGAALRLSPLVADPPTLEPDDRVSPPAPSLRFPEAIRTAPARAEPPAARPMIPAAVAPMLWAVGGILGFLAAIAGGIVWSRLGVEPVAEAPVGVEAALSAPPVPAPVVVPPVAVPVVVAEKVAPVVVAAPVEESPRRQRRRARREARAAEADPWRVSDGSASAEDAAGKGEKKPAAGTQADQPSSESKPVEEENPWGI